MTPTISFHDIELIALGPIAHFDRDDDRADEFWTRDITLRDGDGEFTIGLFSSTSAEQLEFADEAHTPPAAQPEQEDPDHAA